MKTPDYSEQNWQREQNQLEELDRIREKEEKKFQVTEVNNLGFITKQESFNCLECFDTGIAEPSKLPCGFCIKGASPQLELPFKGFDPKEPKGCKSIP